MTTKQKVITKVLGNAVKLIGTNYDKKQRFKIYRGGFMDCSSFVAAMWASAGFPLLDSKGNELLTSMYEVNAEGFELVYPAKRSEIGKMYPSKQGLLSEYGAQAGDIVFWCFDQATERYNKITHVGMIYNQTTIIHISNPIEKCCFKPLSYGDTKVCAIIRLKNDVTLPPLHPLTKDSENAPWLVRAVQVKLNLQEGRTLLVDGVYGNSTVEAVKLINLYNGATSNVDKCSLFTFSKLGFLNPSEPIAPRDLQLTTPHMRGDDVKELQLMLKFLGYDLGTFGVNKDGIDGDFGDMTNEAMRLFYLRLTLCKAGICDVAMRHLLGLKGEQ